MALPVSILITCVGTTRTSGAAAEDDEVDLEVPSPASRLISRLAASLIMKAFFGEVNWPWPLEVDGAGSSPVVISLTLLAEDMAPPMERSWGEIQ